MFLRAFLISFLLLGAAHAQEVNCTLGLMDYTLDSFDPCHRTSSCNGDSDCPTGWLCQNPIHCYYTTECPPEYLCSLDLPTPTNTPSPSPTPT